MIFSLHELDLGYSTNRHPGGQDEAVGYGYQAEYGRTHGWDHVRRLA